MHDHSSGHAPGPSTKRVRTYGLDLSDKIFDIAQQRLRLLQSGKVPALGMLTVPNEVTDGGHPGARRGGDFLWRLRGAC